MAKIVYLLTHDDTGLALMWQVYGGMAGLDVKTFNDETKFKSAIDESIANGSLESSILMLEANYRASTPGAKSEPQYALSLLDYKPNNGEKTVEELLKENKIGSFIVFASNATSCLTSFNNYLRSEGRLIETKMKAIYKESIQSSLQNGLTTDFL